MPYRSYVKNSAGRSVNPQENPSPINSLASFKTQTSAPYQASFNNVAIPPNKIIAIGLYDTTEGLNTPEYQRSSNPSFNTVEGTYTPMNSYVQPSVSGNYILPNGSIYFDERLNLDYLDRAVRTAEENAYLAQISSQTANMASHNAFSDAERASNVADYHANNRKG